MKKLPRVSNLVRVDCSKGHVSKSAKRVLIIDFQKIRATRNGNMNSISPDANTEDAA